MTGLIYLAIIALWAAVLVPMWLRRHDQISEVRSTARFSSAMKSLSSPSQPRYAADAPVGVLTMDAPSRRGSEAPVTSSHRPTEGQLDRDYERELVRQQAAVRRAVSLGVLTLILLTCLVLAMFSVLPKWAPILAALPVIGFVIAASMTASARTTAQPRTRSHRTSRREAAITDQELAAPVAKPAAIAVDDDWENWNAWDDEDSWDAVPTTLPTYVSAPRASAMPRAIERDGEWSGTAMVEQARAMRSRPMSAPLADASEIDHGAATAELPIAPSAARAVNE